MSYYKYLYEYKNKAKTPKVPDNTYKYIILSVVVFLFIIGLFIYLNIPTKKEIINSEKIRRKELDNMYYA